MPSYCLLIIYFILFFIHSLGVIQFIRGAMTIQGIMPLIVATPLGLVSSFLVSSNLLVILELCDVIKGSVCGTIYYLDAFAMIFFANSFVAFQFCRQLSIFKKVSRRFHYFLTKILIARDFLALILIFLGIALMKLNSSFSMEPILSLYYCFISLLTVTVNSITKHKLPKTPDSLRDSTNYPSVSVSTKVSLRTRVIYVKPGKKKYIDQTHNDDKSEKSDKTSTGSLNIKVFRSKYDEAMADINAVLKVSVISCVLGILSTAIMYPFCLDGSFQSGIILSIPWKILVGIPCIAHVQVEIRKATHNVS